MDLKNYLSLLPRGTHGNFAAKVGIDRVYLSQIASRKQGERSFVPSPALAVRIEQATQAQVTRPDLRPDDWREIWPELAIAPIPLAEVATNTVANAIEPTDRSNWDGVEHRDPSRTLPEELGDLDRRAAGQGV